MQRFKQDKSTASKIDTKVSFPLKLEMFPYTNRSRNVDAKQNYELARGCTYDLQTVVVHVGNLDTGKHEPIRSTASTLLIRQAIMFLTLELEARYEKT